jgi:hypothetical protein
MSTLIMVIAHPGATDILNRNLPWLARGGADIAVFNHEGARFTSPLVRSHFYGGRDPGMMPHSYLDRFLMALDLCANGCNGNPHVNYSDFLITEPDSICLRHLPIFPATTDSGLITTVAGHRSGGFRGEHYFHAPWWMDRWTLNSVKVFANRMVKAGITEQGFIDRFLGLLVDLYDIKVMEAKSYSENTLETPESWAKARKAIADGAYFVHGIKTQQQLDEVTKGLS